MRRCLQDVRAKLHAIAHIGEKIKQQLNFFWGPSGAAGNRKKKCVQHESMASRQIYMYTFYEN